MVQPFSRRSVVVSGTSMGPNTLNQLVLEQLSAEDLKAVLKGMNLDRGAKEWKKELVSSDSTWFELHQELTRQCGKGRRRKKR